MLPSPASSLFAALCLGSVALGGFIREVDPRAVYDYVVVGSGAGGAPVAARLALYGHRVLLLDAGEDLTETTEYKVPYNNLKASELTDMSWDFYVHHYPNLEQQRKDSKMCWRTTAGGLHVGAEPPPGSDPLGILYPRAGTLGGCTAHNALFTVYPDDSDWNDIAELTNDRSWAADRMRRIWQRIEKTSYNATPTAGHGYNGWLSTYIANPFNGTERDYKIRSLASAASVDGRGFGTPQTLLDINSDFPGRDQREGLYEMPLAIKPNGERAGPVDFLRQTLADPNLRGKLDIMLNTFVTTIAFDENTPYGRKPRAIGVNVVRGRSIYRADRRAPQKGGRLPAPYLIRAAREVIISAGAFNTPQLLKLSGIGPRGELERFGIPVLVDSPGVGTNLQDRYESTVVGQSPEKFTAPLHFAIMKKSSLAEENIPDLLIAGTTFSFTGYFPGYSNYAKQEPNNKWTWVVLRAHTRNHAGTVQLRSNDPRDVPLINFNYFKYGTNQQHQGEKDAKALQEGLKWAREAFLHTDPRIGFRELWPGGRVQNDEQMLDWVQAEAWGHHASCSCPIGADGDAYAPLDSSFRVRGVDGLRVVDASVFPKIPGYFIVVAIYIMAEKAADVINEAARGQAFCDHVSETKKALPRDTKGESSRKEDDSEPPPAYSEGDSPLLSFAFVMSAAGGPSSIITQVQQGGPPVNAIGDVGADEAITMDLRGTRFVLSRDELLTLPEFVLLSLFPNGLFPEGHMNGFSDDAIQVDYDPASLQYMLDFFRAVAQSFPTESSQDDDTTAGDATSSREESIKRAGIIVLREDLDFYVLPPRTDITQMDMIAVKRAAARALQKQDGIFSGLKRSDEPGTTEAHLIEMLTAGGFDHDDRWGHRAGEPNKAVICSLALARLRSDVRGNDASGSGVGMAQKLLLFWRKPARRCWWEGIELDGVEGVDGKLKVWIRRVWTLEMSVIGLQ
ncbi:Aryl-alcohol oxidase [Ophiocordyceps camponoti-floridani]|uniref:Aryl-alcohol oxidase n=1 Tax=Ophiocordyceps camponoti-floridani TaxID=2030778 RepID=A0A8H4VH27_9HYPO|nr:Aryl-alcohol oxidase [Ophiocordyceps camponoti-floridani]